MDLADHIVIHTHSVEKKEEVGWGYKSPKPKAPLQQVL